MGEGTESLTSIGGEVPSAIVNEEIGRIGQWIIKASLRRSSTLWQFLRVLKRMFSFYE